VRILHIVQRYWPVVGGAEIYLGEISARLARDGHQVTVATTDAWDFEAFWDVRRRHFSERRAEHSGVQILRFPVRYAPGSPLAYHAVRRLLWLFSRVRLIPVALMARLARLTPWVPELWRWLAETGETFDLVTGVNICFESLLEAGLGFAQQRGLPFVLCPLTHLGAGAQPGADAFSGFYTMRHQLALNRASTALIVQTPAECSFYERQGIPAERLVVAGPGVNPEQVLGGDGAAFRARHSLTGPLVISLSAMAYDKGTVHLVEAVRSLWRSGQQVDLVLAGALLEPFANYLAQLPADDRSRIRVLGSVTDIEKRDMFAAADIFAMPSRTDSFGIVYLEAWLYGLPVIGARTWGVNDVIADGQDGLLVPFGDVPDLAAALARLLDDPAERAEFGARGRSKVYGQHLWDHKYALIRGLYQRLDEHASGHQRR
jgi:glycosyltransferase involved in cell wall biosynthesis